MPQNVDGDDVDLLATNEGWSADDDPEGEDVPDGSASATTTALFRARPNAYAGHTGRHLTPLSVTWGALAPGDTGGSAITGYELHRWDRQLASGSLRPHLADVTTHMDDRP